jgi:superkiller protein 3
MLQGTIEPSAVEPIIEEGRALIQGGNTQGAIECFMKAVEGDPSNPKIWNDLGVALFISDQAEAAIEAFQTAIRHNARFADAYINLATAASKTGNAALRETTLENAIMAVPENEEIRDAYRELQATIHGSEEAEAATTETPATGYTPPSSMPKVQAEQDPVAALLEEGRAHANSARFADASQCFLKALELEPKCAAAWNDLGVAMYRNGEVEAAYEALQTCLKHDPGYSDAALNMVPICNQLQRTTEAVVALRSALAVHPSHQELRETLDKLDSSTDVSDEAERQTRAFELMGKGREHLAEKNYAEAGRCFLQATEEAPGFAPPWNDLGVALYLEEHNDLAFQAFETSLELAPGFVDAALNLAKCSVRLGRQSEVQKTLEKAASLNPEATELHEAMASMTGGVSATAPQAAPAPAAQVPAPAAQVSAPAAQVSAPAAQVEGESEFSELEQTILRGREMLMAGRNVDACNAFLDAIAIDLTCPFAWNDLGVALYQSGAVDSAIEAFETAMMHDPTFTDAPVNLSGALIKLGQTDAALNVIQTAMIRCPNDAELSATWQQLQASSGGTGIQTETKPAPVVMDSHQDLVRAHVQGKSFMAIDIDGRKATERVADAVGSGATRATVQSPTAIRDGLVDRHTNEKVGVVYCGEIIERVPNPVQTLNALRQMATDKVIVTTRCLPEHISASKGSLTITSDSACFIPAAGHDVKAILDAYQMEKGSGEVEYINGTAAEGGWLLGHTAEPTAVWWAWTGAFVSNMLESAGFAITKQTESAESGITTFVCQVR